MTDAAVVSVAPILREHDGGVHDDHPLLTRSVQPPRLIDLNAEPWALVCCAEGVSVDVGVESSAPRDPEDHDGVVWVARTICRHGSKVRLGGDPIIRRVDNDARVALWSSIAIYRQILDYEIPHLLALDITANPWVGRLIVYRLLEVTEADRGHDYGAAHLSGGERSWVAKRLREVLSQIPPAVIEDYQATPIAPNRLAALLALAGGAMPAPTLMAETPALPARRVSVFHPAGTAPNDQWRVDGEPVQPALVKTIDHRFFDEVFVHEKIAWLPRGAVELVRDSTTLPVGVHRRRRTPATGARSFTARLRRAVSWRAQKAINAYAPSWTKGLLAPPGKTTPPAEGQSGKTRHPLWLYMDRHDSAGDNAEPLYRYASQHVSGVRHIFALERSSEDWERLQSEGFDLVDIHSDEFDQAWSRADALLLADIGDPEAHPRLTGNRTRRDQRVVFLQHGVTMRDMWRWMNGKRIDVMIAATPVEYHALVDDHTSYTLTEPEVWLTGFPRHDLLHPMLGRERDRVVLAPTWRVSLAHGLDERPDDFAGLDAAYAPWIGLAERLGEAGKRVVLFIHPKIALLAPAWVDGLNLDTTTGRDVPEHLSRAIATVSDRSSILDDAMLLGGTGIVWDPTGSPDTDHYRQMHVNAGALEAHSEHVVIDLIDEAEHATLRTSSAITIPDDQARRRIVERLLAAGLGPCARAPRMIGIPKVSLIVAVYGVADYLPQFFASLDAQTYPHERIEVVLVLDGKIDDSPELCAQWSAGTDMSVRIIEQDNAGQAAARNRGFAAATGEWIGFPDPDDTLNASYIEELVGARDLRSPLLVARMLIRQGEVDSPHPLDFRFQAGTRTIDAAAQPQCIQLATNCCLIHRTALEALGPELFPEDRSAPTFEDAMVIGRVRAADTRMVVVPGAVYYYEKRATGDSAVQTAWMKPGRYVDQFRTRYRPYLRAAKSAPWAQQTVLYDLGWYFTFIDHNPMPSAVGEVWQEHVSLLSEVLAHIDDEQILRSPWGHLTAAARARLFLLKGHDRAAVVEGGEVTNMYVHGRGVRGGVTVAGGGARGGGVHGGGVDGGDTTGVDAAMGEASSAGGVAGTAEEPALYGTMELGYILRGERARAVWKEGIMRIPLWPRKPKLG